MKSRRETHCLYMAMCDCKAGLPVVVLLGDGVGPVDESLLPLARAIPAEAAKHYDCGNII